MPDRNALDRVLRDLNKELDKRIDELEAIGHKAKSMLHEGEKTEKMLERRQEVLENGRDDDGDPINPDIEEALDWLDNQGTVDIEDYVEGVVQVVSEGIAKLKDQREELLDIIRNTPEGSYRKEQSR